MSLTVRIKANEIFIRGLKALLDDTVQKAILAKQAARETRRHRVLTVAWEIEEADRHRELLKVIEVESQEAFREASEEAAFFERLMSSRVDPQLADDLDFFHEAYNEDMLVFSTCERQLDQLEGYVLDKGLAQLDPDNEGVALQHESWTMCPYKFYFNASQQEDKEDKEDKSMNIPVQHTYPPTSSNSHPYHNAPTIPTASGYGAHTQLFPPTYLEEDVSLVDHGAYHHPAQATLAYQGPSAVYDGYQGPSAEYGGYQGPSVEYDGYHNADQLYESISTFMARGITLFPEMETRANMAKSLTKLRPEELVRGVEFTTGHGWHPPQCSQERRPAHAIIFLHTASQAVDSNQLCCCAPYGAAAHTHNGCYVSQPTSNVDSTKIHNHAHHLIKLYVLQHNGMPQKNDDLLPILVRAALDITGDQGAWAKQNKDRVKRLADAVTHIQSMFKHCAAHRVQDVFELREVTAAVNGFSEVQWKQHRVKVLLHGYSFMSVDTMHPLSVVTGSLTILQQVANLLLDVLFIDRLAKYVNNDNHNLLIPLSLAGTMFHWALEQHTGESPCGQRYNRWNSQSNLPNGDYSEPFLSASVVDVVPASLHGLQNTTLPVLVIVAELTTDITFPSRKDRVWPILLAYRSYRSHTEFGEATSSE
ncbi:hypothetical protein BDN67DRAFT_983937 [Paxillus ammoniavirescens]|nr:hypothetical protein BDN67DRAFT_983937 [Paxillus ammoniavirescens]